jgi:hypothetical protein
LPGPDGRELAHRRAVEDPDPKVRAALLALLAGIPASRLTGYVFENLYSMLKHIAGREGLGFDESIRDLLIARGRDEPDDAVRLVALQLLARGPRKTSTTQFLLEQLSFDPSRRRAAAHAIGPLILEPHPDLRSEISTWLTAELDPIVRMELQQYLDASGRLEVEDDLRTGNMQSEGPDSFAEN